MSVEKTYKITLKLAMTEWGSFESVRLLKGNASVDPQVLERINIGLQSILTPSAPVRTIVAIGDDAEQKVMNQLYKISANNSDFQVLDTSNLTGHGDMSIKHQSKQICVEVKCYTKPVPIKEIEKYHKSMALTEYDAGIMIQLDPCGYAASAKIRSPIDIRYENGKPSAYLTAVDLEMLYPIISVLILNCGIDKCNDQTELEKKNKCLIDIHEKILNARECINSQKKIIERLESVVEDIIKLSVDN